MERTRRQRILGVVEDLATNFLYYDRKESESLPMGELEAAVEAGEISWAEIGAAFTGHLPAALNGPPIGGLTLAAVSAVNRQRCDHWHPGFPDDGVWLGSDWSNAMAGEAGEACNIVKKLRRLDTGFAAGGDSAPPDPATAREWLMAKLAKEIGDVYLYLDLLAQFYGLDLAQCVVHAFNEVSVRQGHPERIEVAG